MKHLKMLLLLSGNLAVASMAQDVVNSPSKQLASNEDLSIVQFCGSPAQAADHTSKRTSVAIVQLKQQSQGSPAPGGATSGVGPSPNQIEISASKRGFERGAYVLISPNSSQMTQPGGAASGPGAQIDHSMDPLLKSLRAVPARQAAAGTPALGANAGAAPVSSGQIRLENLLAGVNYFIKLPGAPTAGPRVLRVTGMLCPSDESETRRR